MLPESFLRKALGWLEKIVSLIDQILEPLKQIEKLVLYSCLISWIVLFFNGWTKRGSCELSSLAAIKDRGFSVAIAGYGNKACEQAYWNKDKDETYSDSESCSGCQSCTIAIEKYKKTENTMQWIYDRMFCPTAPIFKNYVESRSLLKEDGNGIYECKKFIPLYMVNVQ